MYRFSQIIVKKCQYGSETQGLLDKNHFYKWLTSITFYTAIPNREVQGFTG